MKLITVISIAKKHYNDSFVMENFQIHPTMIPFLSSMELNRQENRLQPFVAPVNHNTLTSANAIQIVHTLMGNFCHGDIDKVSQLEDMGNDSCLRMGYCYKVSSDRFLQIICIPKKIHQCLTQLSILRMTLWNKTNQLQR
jgi:hypothetical protein